MSSLSLLCFWLYAVMYCGLFFLFFLMIRRPPRSTRTAHSFPTRRSSDLANFPEFHNVYIEPCSYEVYKKTNVFPEGTVFFKELQLVLPTSSTSLGEFPDGSTNEPSGRGYFPGKWNGADVTVKDTQRYADSGGWGYFNFNHHEPKAK